MKSANDAMGQSAHSPSTSDRNGVVLIVVLVLVVMIALAGFGFLADMTVEYEATKINGDQLAAQQTLASGEAWVMALLDDTPDRDILLNDPQLFSPQTVMSVTADARQSSANDFSQPGTTRIPDSAWQFSVLQPETTASAIPFQTFDDDLFDQSFNGPRYGLARESAKLHLSLLLELDAIDPDAARVALQGLPGMSAIAADSLLDWLDDDDTPREFGAEREHYERLDPPYQPRNGIPRSLEELRFVRGVPSDAFSKNGTNWNALLTLLSRERNTDPQGNQRLDLNTGEQTDLEELEAALTQFVSEELARYVRLARLYGLEASHAADETSDPSNDSSSGGSSANKKIVEKEPLDASLDRPEDESTFLITSLTELIDSEVRIPPSASGSSPAERVRSPLQSTDLSSLGEEFRKLEQFTTVEAAPIILGRLNINDASETVLNAVLGDPAITTQVISQRGSLSVEERRSTVWLLQRQLVDVETFQQLHPLLTTGGDVFSCDIIAFRRSGGPALRRSIIVDAAGEFARRVHWRNRPVEQLPPETDSVDMPRDSRREIR